MRCLSQQQSSDMVAARVLWTLCAIATTSAIAWATHDWASQILFQTPYQMWPIAGVMIAYAYLFALAVIVGAGFVIYEIWTR